MACQKDRGIVFSDTPELAGDVLSKLKIAAVRDFSKLASFDELLNGDRQCSEGEGDGQRAASQFACPSVQWWPMEAGKVLIFPTFVDGFSYFLEIFQDTVKRIWVLVLNMLL